MNEKTYRHGHFVWRELMTTDLAKAKAFYSGLFGWTLADMPFSDGAYTLISNGEKQIGGMMSVPEGAPPVSFWHSYASVASVDAAVSATKEAGGNVLVGPIDAPNVGRFAVLMDPTGAVFSVITQENGDGEACMPPAGAFCWESLNTSDAGAMLPFYEKAVGWAHKDHNGMSLLFAGENMVADVGSPPPGVPSHWITHIVVENLERSRDLSVSLGGQVMMGEVPVPGIGRLAVIQDPAGATLSLFESAQR